ncbi:amidohydrolase family protein [Flindersiella endophytica]
MILDAHVRVGKGREVDLSADALLTTMAELGISGALVAPDEAGIAWSNREANRGLAAVVAASDGRLAAYAVANPWQPSPVEELRRAFDGGAVALAVDPVLQGFDVLDGLVDPLLAYAREVGWLVYIRTGTPPSAVPLPVASLARRFPDVRFLMGRSGATDFWIDAAPALRHAPNLFADTSYAPWDTVLSEFAGDPEIGTDRCVFSTDAPYTVPKAELKRILDWSTISSDQRSGVLGGNLLTLLGSHAPSSWS